MSLLDGKPTPLSPTACGNCRWWAPWLRQQDVLGTCGHAINLGHCTDKHDTCEGFAEKASPSEKNRIAIREYDKLCGLRVEPPCDVEPKE